MTAIILLTIVVIVFISMARQKFGPDLGNAVLGARWTRAVESSGCRGGPQARFRR